MFTDAAGETKFLNGSKAKFTSDAEVNAELVKSNDIIHIVAHGSSKSKSYYAGLDGTGKITGDEAVLADRESYAEIVGQGAKRLRTVAILGSDGKLQKDWTRQQEVADGVERAQ